MKEETKEKIEKLSIKLFRIGCILFGISGLFFVLFINIFKPDVSNIIFGIFETLDWKQIIMHISGALCCFSGLIFLLQ